MTYTNKYANDVIVGYISELRIVTYVDIVFTL